MARNYNDVIGIEVVNNKELLELFKELKFNIQSQIIVGALKKSGKLILDEARANWKARRKNKSKTDYQDYQFKSEEIKKSPEKFGVKIGIPHSYGSYKIHFVESGTKQRFYKSKFSKQHATGQIKPMAFFKDAVNARKAEAQEMISTNVKKNIEKIISKYSK